jgi:hypothetical protein
MVISLAARETKTGENAASNMAEKRNINFMV